MNKMECATARGKIQRALDALGPELGMKLQLGRITFTRDGRNIRCKLTGTDVDSRAQAPAAPGAAAPTGQTGALFERACLLHLGTKVEPMKWFRLKNTRYRITGYNANRPAYPWDAVNERGRGFKLSHTQARDLLTRPA